MEEETKVVEQETQDTSTETEYTGTGEVVLSAKNIRKTFDGPVPTEVLKGIDFEVREGEFVAILGESGSGKSTFLYCLAGIETPTEGEILIGGKDITTAANWTAATAAAGAKNVVLTYEENDTEVNAVYDIEVKEDSVTAIKVNLGEGNSACTIWTGDFTYEYVKINADYHT